MMVFLVENSCFLLIYNLIDSVDTRDRDMSFLEIGCRAFLNIAEEGALPNVMFVIKRMLSSLQAAELPSAPSLSPADTNGSSTTGDEHNTSRSVDTPAAETLNSTEINPSALSGGFSNPDDPFAKSNLNWQTDPGYQSYLDGNTNSLNLDPFLGDLEMDMDFSMWMFDQPNTWGS